MFFDSLYQLVNLWADGVEVSFYQFLVDLYNNIAEWNEAYNCPKFKPLSGVGCRGAEFEQNKADAQASKDAQARAQREKEEEEERRRQEAERMRVAELERLRQGACRHGGGGTMGMGVLKSAGVSALRGAAHVWYGIRGCAWASQRPRPSADGSRRSARAWSGEPSAQRSTVNARSTDRNARPLD